jgi:hypothetical protein
MLLPNDFDCAAGRRHLFGDCRTFYAKLVLTRRESEGKSFLVHLAQAGALDAADYALWTARGEL